MREECPWSARAHLRLRYSPGLTCLNWRADSQFVLASPALRNSDLVTVLPSSTSPSIGLKYTERWSLARDMVLLARASPGIRAQKPLARGRNGCPMRIAVVHDYFTQSGGAEKVAEELYQMVPGATLVSTVALQEKLRLLSEAYPFRLHGCSACLV